MHRYASASSTIGAPGLVFTGLLIYLVLPPGSGHGKMTVLGMDRHGWGDVHFWLAVAVLALVVVHVALHWQWVSTMVMRMLHRRGAPSRARRNAIGLVFVLAIAGLIAGLLWWADATKQVDDTPGPGSGRRLQQHR